MQDTAHNDFELDDFEEETFSTGLEVGAELEDDEDEFVRASDFEEDGFEEDDLGGGNYQGEGTHPEPKCNKLSTVVLVLPVNINQLSLKLNVSLQC